MFALIPYHKVKNPHPKGAALVEPPIGGQNNFLQTRPSRYQTFVNGRPPSLGHRFANAGTGYELFKKRPFQPFPFGTGIASPHDPTLRVGVSDSL